MNASKTPEIIYLTHGEVDKTQWDKAIGASVNKSVYALSWFLDIVCPGWEALVEDDYVSVFPLPVHSKFGLKYLVQPMLCQQLGLFATNNDSNSELFLSEVRKQFLFVNINLNSKFRTDNNKTVSSRLNQYLHLNERYSSLQKFYSGQCLRKIKKGLASQLVYSEDVEVDDFFFLLFSSSRFKYNKKFEGIVRAIVSKALDMNQGFITGVYEGNNLISSAFWLKSFDRVILLLPVSSQSGLKNNAMYFIVDNFIKNNALTGVILDFEGSNIKGIADFNRGFGAVDEIYQSVFFTPIPFLKQIMDRKKH